jgi:fumarate reductase flavoprotein subunit
VIAGAGMAGLCAAARARELGASVLLLEKGDRAGGNMLLSSGFVWRHRDWERLRQECPRGDEALQRLLWERLDEGLRWLEGLGAPVSERDTGNPLTTGLRFEPRGLSDALVEAAGEVRLAEPLVELPSGPPLVLATGGFQADRGLVREHVTPEAEHLLLRATPWSTGDGLRLGLRAGGRPSGGMDEFYGRNMPAPPARVEQEDFVALAQLYARHARVRGARGEEFECSTWSEIDVVQWTARQPGARAWYEVPEAALEQRVRDRSVGQMVAAAERAGAPVERRDGSVAVEVVAGITTTLGGLRVDRHARVADGVYACGSDMGGISGGGYLSGLAAALVFGRLAAESALEEAGA